MPFSFKCVAALPQDAAFVSRVLRFVTRPVAGGRPPCNSAIQPARTAVARGYTRSSSARRVVASACAAYGATALSNATQSDARRHEVSGGRTLRRAITRKMCGGDGPAATFRTGSARQRTAHARPARCRCDRWSRSALDRFSVLRVPARRRDRPLNTNCFNKLS